MSLKSTLNTAAEFSFARLKLAENPSILDSVICSIVGSNGELKADSNPMSKIVHGLLKPNYTPYSIDNGRFYVLRNRPENDLHWNDYSPEWIGKASMSLHHVFVVPGSQLMENWKLSFNALTFPATQQTLQMLEDMKRIALSYAHENFVVDEKNNKITPPLSHEIGLYFHIYPNNSIHHLHLHIIDLRFIGPTYNALCYKNMPIDEVIAVIKDELQLII